MFSAVRNLLYAGVAGPLLFIGAFLIEGFTRPGYSQWRNYVSQLATGDSGWTQVVNFLVCGGCLLLFAIGLRSALTGSRAAIGAPVIFGLFGLALLAAGIFSTDPALGYPAGAPPVHTTHGLIHGLAGLFAFSALSAAAFVMAWHFGGRPGSRRWQMYSLAVGFLVIALFIAFTATSAADGAGRWPSAPTGLLQRIAIIAGWTWIAMVAWCLLRESRLGAAHGDRVGLVQ